MFLSIIIPVYNTDSLLIEECLNSIKKSSIDIDYEIIIVNDGSTNTATIDYLSDLEKQLYNIITTKNKGASNARNTGIEMAKGKYIYPLDSDDLLHEDFPLFIDYLKKYSETDILYGDLYIFGDEERIVYHPDFNKIALCVDENIIPSCSFFKKNIWKQVKGYDTNLLAFEDYDFWIRSTFKAKIVKHISNFAYKHRIINDGKSLIQKTKSLHDDYLKTIISKNQACQITKTDINHYLITNFKKKKRKAIGFLIYIYAPNLYNFLTSLKLFSYKKNFID